MSYFLNPLSNSVSTTLGLYVGLQPNEYGEKWLYVIPVFKFVDMQRKSQKQAISKGAYLALALMGSLRVAWFSKGNVFLLNNYVNIYPSIESSKHWG